MNSTNKPTVRSLFLSIANKATASTHTTPPPKNAHCMYLGWLYPRNATRQQRLQESLASFKKVSSFTMPRCSCCQVSYYSFFILTKYNRYQPPLNRVASVCISTLSCSVCTAAQRQDHLNLCCIPVNENPDTYLFY